MTDDIRAMQTARIDPVEFWAGHAERGRMTSAARWAIWMSALIMVIGERMVAGDDALARWADDGGRT